MLNAIDLFSGYGGITLALKDYSRPIIYCEIEKYCQGIILSRMDEGALSFAPIWDDVATLDGAKLRGLVDIIVGGFPCQDISVAGKGVGLEGERSGLFFEIVRLAEEIKPTFLFLENVAAIRTRGLDRVIEELTEVGYDCRWCMLSAADVGANHKRERWFLLAHSQSSGDRGRLRDLFEKDASIEQPEKQYENTTREFSTTSKEPTILAYTNERGLPEERTEQQTAGFTRENIQREWWSTQPNVGRVAIGVPIRVDRIKRLGNAVVPLQVRTAFEYLMGVKRV